MRILVVDDDDDVQNPVARTLRVEGHAVVTAPDLASARECMAAGVDRIVLDLIGRLRRKLGSDLIRTFRCEGCALAEGSQRAA